jgi:hypothetical protein
MRASHAIDEDIEVLPVVVVTRAFAARPSSVPDIRAFVREQLARTALSNEHVRALGRRVADVLLEAAGEGGKIKVSLRIFADHAEVDLLQDNDRGAIGTDGSHEAPPAADRGSTVSDRVLIAPGASGDIDDAQGAAFAGPEPATTSAMAGWAAERSGVTFAVWLAEALRRRGMTMEAASRQLRVSVKTVSRWIGGTTEPRLRDLSRIREVFGDLPPP